MFETMLEGLTKLRQAVTINTVIVEVDGDVPVVRIDGFPAEFEVIDNGHGSYDVWTVRGEVKPVKFNLSLDQAAALLVKAYKSAAKERNQKLIAEGGDTDA